jgi:hypothetical protein
LSQQRFDGVAADGHSAARFRGYGHQVHRRFVKARIEFGDAAFKVLDIKAGVAVLNGDSAGHSVDSATANGVAGHGGRKKHDVKDVAAAVLEGSDLHPVSAHGFGVFEAYEVAEDFGVGSVGLGPVFGLDCALNLREFKE